MPLSISDRESIRFKPEAAFGVVAGTGNFYNLRMNGESLLYDIKTAKSKEIINDRSVRDLIVVDAAASGPVPAEFSYGEYDWLIEAALATTVANVVGTNGTGTGTGTFSATSFAFSAGTPFANVASGQWIGFTGSASGNNKLAQVTGILGAGTGVSVASGTFVAETGTTGIVAMGARFCNGATVKTFSIERLNADLNAGTGLFECFRGNLVDKWSQKYAPGQIIGQTFEFIGKDALPMSTGSALPGTGVASLVNRIMNSVNNISNITEGGASLTGTFVKSLDFNVMNNSQGQDSIGNLGNIGIQLGEFNCELQLVMYLADATYYNKFINNTGTSFSYRMTDPAGNAYVVTLPNSRYTTGSRPNPGRNQSIMLTLGVEALKDPVTGFALIIDRCGVAVTPWA